MKNSYRTVAQSSIIMLRQVLHSTDPKLMSSTDVRVRSNTLRQLDKEINYRRRNHQTIILEDIDISCRLFNVLKTYKINTLNEVALLSYKDIVYLKGMGKGCIDELNTILHDYGFSEIKPNMLEN